MTEIHDEEHSSFLSRLFTKRGEPSNQNELEQVIHEASENDVIDEDTEDMIQGIFDINRLRVSDVMIPSSDIVTINATDSLAETAKKVVENKVPEKKPAGAKREVIKKTAKKNA